jgi:hypothetical protein
VALEVEVEAVLPGPVGDRPRLDLAEIDARRPSSPELAERRRAVRQVDQQRGLARRVARAGARLARQLDEAGEVVALVLDLALSTARPWRAAASSLAIAAVVGSPFSRTLRAAPAVSNSLRTDAQGSVRRNASHWRSAWGCEITRRRSSRRAPAKPTRQCSIALTTSPMIVAPPSARQVVGLVDAAGGRVLDRQQRDVGLAALHHRRAPGGISS